MTGTTRLAFLALALAAACCLPVRAENPRISLRLQDVTGTEAMAALSKAAGISIELPDPFYGVGEQLQERLQARAAFDWTNVRFAAALRELCARYNVRPSRRPSGSYTLYPAAAAPGLPAKRVGLTEKGGVRLFMRRIGISSSRDIDFDDGPNSSNPGSMSLYFGAELPDGDAETVAGLDNVSAMDDLGNLLAPEQFGFRGGWSGFGGGIYPDEWSGSFGLPAPHPKARKLLWVEGDLTVYRKYRPLRVEIPLPVPAGGARKQVGETTVVVDRFEAAPAQPEGQPDQPMGGPFLQARIILPADPANAQMSMRDSLRSVALLGASGKLYDMFSGGGGGGGRTYNLNYTFHRVNEPVTAAVFMLVEKGDPERLLSFRMTNIPLPGDPIYIPRRASTRPARPGTASAAPERPFQETGGGTLVSRIQIGDQPAPEGTLSIGLVAKNGNEWSGIRWLEAPVNKDGLATLEELKPGTYRLLRVYRMKEAPQLRTDGRWRNGEVTIEVPAGKETTAPPLIWSPLPPEKAPGAQKRPAPIAKPRK